MDKRYLIRNFVTGEIYSGIDQDGNIYFDKEPYYYKKIKEKLIDYYLKECIDNSKYNDIFEVVEIYCND